MSGELDAQTAGKVNYRALGIIIGLILGIIFDSIPVFFVIGLNIGVALEKRHWQVAGRSSSE
jgi:hypothetical protein